MVWDLHFVQVYNIHLYSYKCKCKNKYIYTILQNLIKKVNI
jgi:hypothetical protein